MRCVVDADRCMGVQVTRRRKRPPVNETGPTRDAGGIPYKKWALHVGDRSFVQETISTRLDRHSAATTKQWLEMDESSTLWDGLDVAETYGEAPPALVANVWVTGLADYASSLIALARTPRGLLLTSPCAAIRLLSKRRLTSGRQRLLVG